MTSGEDASGSIDAVLFDLDGTLYPTGNGYVGHVRQNLYTWMHDRCATFEIDSLASRLQLSLMLLTTLHMQAWH